MPYRDESPDALRARCADLERRLAETKEELQEALEEIAWLRRKQARAMTVLRMIAETSRVRQALDELRRSDRPKPY